LAEERAMGHRSSAQQLAAARLGRYPAGLGPYRVFAY
jgi:hypothetical protein